MLPRLSRLSVSNVPGIRLRLRCSARYQRISPLHLAFQSPLPYSSWIVSDALSGLSPEISHPTRLAAYAPFTPSKSEQRLRPLYYRGCWHRVSRRFLLKYTQLWMVLAPIACSLMTGVYNPKAFFIHAAWLGQSFLHCPIFLAAASRRSLDRVSVPAWLIVLSDQLWIIALVGRYPTNWLIQRGHIHHR